MRINKLTDYAIVLLARLSAGEHDRLWTAAELAGDTRLPLQTVIKLLKQLARGDVLMSFRGVKGGYRLSRPPEAITVADVLRALEGPGGITECIGSPSGTCGYESLCFTHDVWRRVDAAVWKVLERFTLVEMSHSQLSLCIPGEPPSRARTIEV